jgi:hypothetical protein
MAGRDCLPATPFDSAGRTHDPRRALTRTESSKTPHSCFATYVRQHTTNSEFAVRAQDMQAKHVCAQPKRPGCSASLRPCIRPRPRAHCCWQMPDLRYLPEKQNPRHRHAGKFAMRAGPGGVAQHCRGGWSTHLPGPRAPEARPRTIPCPVGLHFAALAQICAKQAERAAVESRASSRAHLWACPAISTGRPEDSGLY